MEDKEKNKKGYSGEVYLITLDGGAGIVLQDTNALRIINELNTARKVNNLFLKRDERYCALKEYCAKWYIELGRVRDNSELVEEITRFYGYDFRRSVYVTHSEDADSLEDSLSELADWGFYTEIKNT